MLIKEIEGLKFPVEYIIRFFFREGLHKRTGKVLELGSGNGNNIMLFYQYGWDVTGVDNASILIEQANRNFLKVQNESGLTNSFHHFCDDMANFVTSYSGPEVDVLLLPHSIYYLPHDKIVTLVRQCKTKGIIKDGTILFLTVRTPEDYRFGKGRRLSEKSFELTIDETGEKGCTITFFTEQEILYLLGKFFKLNSKIVLSQVYENYQNGQVVKNSDITIWGKIGITGQKGEKCE